MGMRQVHSPLVGLGAGNASCKAAKRLGGRDFLGFSLEADRVKLSQLATLALNVQRFP